MVLPLVLGGAAIAARFLIPRALPVAARFGTAAARFVLPKTFKGALVQAVAVPTAAAVFIKSPTAREVVTTTLDPRASFARGGLIAEKIEGLGKGEKEKIIGGAAAAGIAGVAVVGAGLVIAKLKKPKAIASEKPITPQTQIIQTQPTALAEPMKANGKAVNVTVNVSQKQTKRIKNIVVFQ